MTQPLSAPAHPGNGRGFFRVSSSDRVLSALDRALKVLTVSAPAAHRPCPRPVLPSADTPPGSDPLQSNTACTAPLSVELSPAERRHSAGLMRVNHAGEVAAQGLYQGQALVARDPALRAFLLGAADEESDHLSWTAQRLAELDARPSLLSPVWFFGAFALGVSAAIQSDARSLGFLMETEHQVEAHLQSHLEQLPAADLESRAIVAQMAQDEAIHGQDAAHHGAVPLPAWVQQAMTWSAELMTKTAYWV